MGDGVRGGGGFGIDEASCHIHLHQRGRFGESAGLQDKVGKGLVLGIPVGAGIDHLAMDGDGLKVGLLLGAGHIEHVFALQCYIGYPAVQDALDVYGDDLQGTVTLQTVHHGMRGDGILSHAVGLPDERTDGAGIAVNLVHARTEHGTLHLYHIGIS